MSEVEVQQATLCIIRNIIKTNTAIKKNKQKDIKTQHITFLKL